ncbi:P-loop containing nucleoside triphosphate hydrolase protein, partial [Cunninghamella echinulata]
PHYIQGGQLLGHQLEGLNWLLYQWERQQPCILADDMGLGKTIQIVVFLYVLFKKYNIYPFLLVVPNSTVMNWVREFSKWAPEMVVVPYQGSRQSREYARKFEIFKHSSNSTITSCHAVITTYESSLQDYTQFSNVKTWPYLIVDEAHRLKNKSSQLFQKLDQLKTDNRVLLTGTPLQNNIEELITIMNFIDSKKFQNITELGKHYSQLTHETIPELHSQLKPYFLRRTKETELTDLSPKKELIVPVSMTSLQKELYKATLMKNASIIAQLRKIAASSVGLAEPKKKLNNSNILMELRKILNHPYLIHGVELIQSDAKAMQQAMIDASAKLSLLHMILPKLKAKGHRVLIFSTMAIMLDILEDYLIFENLNYVRIDGSTNQETRVENIDRFNDPESSVFVFLLTTRAGGVGINLATADTVILFDSDFNPHADMQAICRAHRFGQKKPVLVLRLITRLSAEERILEKSKKKMIMDHLVVEKMDDETIELDDIENILKFGAQALFENDDSKDIVYDAAAVDDLLNRELQFADMMKENKKKNDNSDEIMGDQEKNGYKNQAQDQQKSGTSENNNTSFSFAKIWQTHSKSNDTGNNQGNSSETDTYDELILGTSTDEQRDNNIWEQLLEKNKQELAKQELEKEKLGRGARQRKAVVSFL